MKPPFEITPEELTAFAVATKRIHEALVTAGFTSSDAIALMGQVLGYGIGAAMAAAQ